MQLPPVPSVFLSRRSLVSVLLLAGCGRKRANRYLGWMLVSSAAERGIAVADLSDFRRMAMIRVKAKPGALLRTNAGVVAICSEPSSAVLIDPARMAVTERLALPAKPVTAVATGDGNTVAVLATDPDCMLLVDGRATRVTGRVPLPARGDAMDVSSGYLAVSMPQRRSIARISMEERRVIGETARDAFGSPLRFRSDGKTLLAGNAARREILSIDWASGRLQARLPTTIEPRRFCFDATGGQMFVTGPGADAVAIVAPYQYEVSETIAAGRKPGAMTVSRNLLLVANGEAGDVTILDIESRQLAASVHVGDTPRELLATPDGEYVLVVDGSSGAIAVIRLTTVLNQGENGLTARGVKPLFTVFPMTAAPESAIVIPYSA
jgi:DNA-binding beta-propeller fold protein YncE